MENSIEEDIILLKDFTEGNFKRDKLENYKGSYKMGYFYYKDIQQALEHILSDYKRVLKENEELKEEVIPVQKVKDKIEKEIKYHERNILDIENITMLKGKTAKEEAEIEFNKYAIVVLKKMLQELLESEE